ncbi:MAG TPA: type I-F CRISPR-associated protein Csy1, partial [Flexistipes sinusarabici]|nr:type I-F CRISPR-associated protein Csy1 [Flexistipes sinusarabici]
FALDNWIEDAARRASWLSLSTHSVKFTHPDAKGSSIFLQEANYNGDDLVGTHSLREEFIDAVGNAAALDIFSFLKQEVNSKTILQLVQESDPELLETFSEDEKKAEKIRQSFESVTKTKLPSSHTLVKQVYFPVENSYHLLSPLFPSSLVHKLHGYFNYFRFSEEIKQIRDLKAKKLPHNTGYRFYPDIAVQEFGGSKPQNISQLNSERGGKAYLLPSLPPLWKSAKRRPILHIDDPITQIFARRFDVEMKVKGIVRFLKRYANQNNMEIRGKSEGYFNDLLDELILFTFEMWELEAGWSLDENCRLKESFKLWIDPGRGKIEDAFYVAFRNMGWISDVTKAYVKWLTDVLEKEAKKKDFKLILGDEEIFYLRKETAEALEDIARGYEYE